MAADYRQMWTELGLDLPAHDALLDVLGQAYGDIYMSQKNRPEGMQYFDFVMSEVHGLRIKELRDAQGDGRKVIGSFCVFVPEELILAVDGISVGLCAGAEFGFDKAEEVLPRNICALIKSAFGFKLGKVCPYVESSDMIVGENTCDGKKKAYELLKELVKNLFILDLPQMKSEAGKALLKSEYQRFAKALEELSGKKITVQSLRKGIELVNQKRKAIHRLSDLRKHEPAPISGLDALLINQVFFYDDPARFTASVNKICDELEQRVKRGVGVRGNGTPRIVISGSPMAVPNWKIPWIVESSGAIIVGEESCVGERGTQWLTDESGDTVEQLIDNLVERYFQIDCAIFTPNPSRLEHIKSMVKKYNAQGVIHYSLQFCQPYQIESGPVEKALEAEGIPVLRIDTDYSQEDAGQIKTRVEAFIERIGDHK
ncbi:MAG: double-cubane-cluster-containing anaerobic reductase [candidate division KSB1 bacterium]|nr:double-cubane-cluster-containing anaerobic reductase [candidate division KSB1 bacterium]MDZ7335837.1 double-cubane-cluster-containing anaerobic reductase [candidate division KSB1 bacterium]MDZ7356168.1 double-cubane-cluster-containing anaerobic reductase [candidate division KSB1 bacterium]MDZ7375614.1 double-cubane-cluster-containing anaerobic reductase [candidate division KSB1 bacterium]MDZ7400311.1 double-cubane-cluster-containing anaerobic reductase [candidate division KSB1 bacterium]